MPTKGEFCSDQQDNSMFTVDEVILTGDRRESRSQVYFFLFKMGRPALSSLRGSRSLELVWVVQGPDNRQLEHESVRSNL